MSRLREVHEREWEALCDRWKDLRVEADRLVDPALRERFTSLAAVIGQLLKAHAVRDECLREVEAAAAREALLREMLAERLAERQQELSRPQPQRHMGQMG